MIDSQKEDFSYCEMRTTTEDYNIIELPAYHEKKIILSLLSNFKERYEHVAIIIPNLNEEYKQLPDLVKKISIIFKQKTAFRITNKIDETVTTTYDLKFTKNVYLYTNKLSVKKNILKGYFKENDLHLIIRDSEFRQRLSEMNKKDVFICHDSNDKEFVKQLYRELSNNNIRVWYDEFSLEIGDSLIDKINEGVKNSDYGIIVISKQFMKNFGWPHEEYKMFKISEIINKKKIILPIWRSDVSSIDVANYALDLVDKIAGKEIEGVEKIIEKITKVVKNKSR